MTVYTGTQGSNVSWTLDDTTGILEITGTGAMSTSTNNTGYSWYTHRGLIKEVRFGKGVTNVGCYAFYSGNNTLYTNLEKVKFSDTITTIEYNSFYGCKKIKELVFPKSLTTIEMYAFGTCSAITSLTFNGSIPSMPSRKQGLGTYTRQFYDIGDATVYSPGWASNSVFPTTIRGGATFTYELLKGSIIPVNVKGIWKGATPFAKVNGVWKEVTAWCKDNGIWHKIGGDYEGYTGLAVFFDANGGEGHIDPILTESTATIPDNAFSLAGHTFVGWNTAPDGSGTSYSVGQSVTLSENLTLYAIWARQYVVSFEANGGTGTVATITSTSATITLPANAFTRSGYRYDRWSTTADGSGTSYAPGQTITVSSDLVLYAVWIQQFTVRYLKKWQGDNMLWHPPGSNTGPVNGGYLDLKVGGTTVAGLNDKFTVYTDSYYSPEYSITVDAGTPLSVTSKQEVGSGSSVIKRNDVNASGPATSVSYNMSGGVQCDLNILMTWRITYSWLGKTTGSWWIIDIWDR